jgi:hypothetical protein
MGNSLTGTASHGSRPPRLLAEASVVEAHWLGGGGRCERAGRGDEATRWRRARQIGPGEECGTEEAAWGGSVEEALGDGARRCRGPMAARWSGVDGWAR